MALISAWSRSTDARSGTLTSHRRCGRRNPRSTSSRSPVGGVRLGVPRRPRSAPRRPLAGTASQNGCRTSGSAPDPKRPGSPSGVGRGRSPCILLCPAAIGSTIPKLLPEPAQVTSPHAGPGEAACAPHELVAQPSFNATRSITIDAAPEAVWPWIVQLFPARLSHRLRLPAQRRERAGVPMLLNLRRDVP